MLLKLKITSFLALSDSEQFEYIFSNGKCVAEIKKPPIHQKLFSVGSFYVEVHFFESNQKIIMKKIFKEGELLEKYLVEYNQKIPKKIS